jgi:hypothetical protein
VKRQFPIRMTARQATLIAYACVLLATWGACFLYPDDAVLPLPLAAVFGPFVAMRLGFSGGILMIVLSLGLAMPFVWKPHPITALLLCWGIVLWLYAGFAAGQWLYA